MQKNDYFNQESERFYYRGLKKSDQEEWSHFFIGNDRLRFLGIDPADKSPEMLAAAFIEKQFDRYLTSNLGHLAVCSKENDALIGLSGILAETIEGTPMHEVAYSLLPEHWGKGYATEMAKQMKRFGLEALGLSSMISIIHIENHDSAKVAIKNGMTIWKNTTYLDFDVMIYRTNQNK